jgi:hypothetical protein
METWNETGTPQQTELDHRRLQKLTAGAASREKPDSQPNQQVVGGIPAAVFVEHDFAGRLVRILLKAGEPWFVAADVCRALQLASHKGSRAAHLDKLDDDEKLQISREAIVADDAGHPRVSFSPLGDRRGFAIDTPDWELFGCRRRRGYRDPEPAGGSSLHRDGRSWPSASRPPHPV